MIIASFRKCFTPRLNALVGVALLLASGLARSETVFESPNEAVRLIQLFTPRAAIAVRPRTRGYRVCARPTVCGRATFRWRFT